MADGYNTEFPAWINQTKRDDANIGFQMGQNILQGLRFQEQRQEYVDQAPIRAAQLAQSIAQGRIVQTTADQQAIGAGLMANARLGQTQALKVEADAASKLNGWLDPTLPGTIAETIAQYPGLNDTPWHKRMLESIETARTAQDRANEVQLNREQALNIAQERMMMPNSAMLNIEDRHRVAADSAGYASAFADFKSQGMTDLDAHSGAADLFPLASQGKTRLLSPAAGSPQAWQDLGTLMDTMAPAAALDQIVSTTTGTASYRVRPAAESVKNTVNALNAVGIEPPKAEILNAFSQAISGYGAGNADPKTVKDLATENTSATLLDQATKDMADFKVKFPGLTFDEFVGPFDNRKLRFERSVLPPKDMAAATVEANRIFRKVSQIVQGYRNGQFGTALTANETEAFKDIVSDPRFADYESAIGGFKDTIRETMKVQIQPLIMAPNVRIEYKRKFWEPSEVPNRNAAPAAAGQPAAPSSAPVQVNSQAEYDAVPVGAKFIDSTGAVKTKRIP